MSEAAAPAEAAPKKRSKLPLILAAVVLLAAGAGGTWFWLQKGKAKEGEPEHAAEVKKAPPVFHPMDTFTVNLADRDRYLQLGIVYELRDNPTVEALKAVNPVVRSRILLALSAKTAEELTTVEGKKALAEQLIAEARQAMPEPEEKAKGKEKDKDETKGVEGVHFSAFVIQ